MELVMKEYIFPTRIIESKGAENQNNLLINQPLQIGLSETKITCFNNGGHIILDFNNEMCGGIRILTFTSHNSSVRIRFGESVTECCSEIGGDENATNDHSLRDFETNLVNLSDMTFCNTGFRFVRIDFYGETQIKCIVAVNHILNKKTLYTYNGSDDKIAEIYNVAKRTVDLCAAGEYVWDGVKRDRLVWVGDMHPEMLALTTLYGRVAQIEKSLDFVKDQTPLPLWMNNIPMYSMWWIIILADYYKKTKCTSFIKKQLKYLSDLVCQIDSCVSDDGSFEFPFNFVDWPTKDTPDEIHGVRAICIISVKKAIGLLTEFGINTSCAQELLNKLLKVEISPESSKQVTALKFFATELNNQDRKRLTDGGANGMSTFMSYYILKAVASFDKQTAINMMKEYYGGMLEKGATTFWEDFDISWAENSCRIDEFPKDNQKDIHGDFGAFCYKGFRHSLCHGWSAGVLQFIKEECE